MSRATDAARAELVEGTAWVARAAERLAEAAKSSEEHGPFMLAQAVVTIQQELHLLGMTLEQLGVDMDLVTPQITRRNGRYLEEVA